MRRMAGLLFVLVATGGVGSKVSDLTPARCDVELAAAVTPAAADLAIAQAALPEDEPLGPSSPFEDSPEEDEEDEEDDEDDVSAAFVDVSLDDGELSPRSLCGAEAEPLA